MSVALRNSFFVTVSMFLLMGTLALAFVVQSSEAKLETSANSGFSDLNQEEQNLLGDRGLRDFGWSDNEFARLVVGVDAPKHQIQDLEKMITDEGGNVIDTISEEGNVRALTVEVPTAHAYSFAEELQKNEVVKYVEPDSKVNASFVPNDPYWPQQWGPKKIQADIAWNTTIGSLDILVAIVDTGIDYTHPDLATNYVPLGYDWVNRDSDPMDDHGHGTHCAGIVAAKINNSVGIAGIAQVRIMAEKVLNQQGQGWDTWIAEGIINATDSGAKIISMSIGGGESDLLHDAVKYAYDHGVLLVAAAGNNHNTEKVYPAAYDEVVAVTATDSNDKLAWFSSYGTWVELAAPGVDILSTIPGGYASWKGTSMACPHVTGVAALVWSIYKNYTNVAIRDHLRRTADDLGFFGFDEYYGYGRVNARKAVMPIPEHDLCITGWQHPHRINPGQPGTFNVTVSNYGTNNETSVSVQFFVNETMTSFKSIDFLKIGASTSVSFSWSTTILGNYNFTSYVIPVPGENMTENNIASSNVRVRFPTVLRVPSEYLTVREAVNNASEEDKVLVSDGYYAEGQIDILENNITLIADGHAILDGQNQEYVLNIGADHIVIQGFRIQNGSKCGVNVKGYGNNLTRNDIEGNTDGVRLSGSHNSIISLNKVIIERKNEYQTFRYCIILDDSSNNTISSNNLTGGALWLYYSEFNILDSNKITNASYGLAITTSPYNRLRNNIMTNNTRNFCVFMREDFTTVIWYPWQAINDVDASNTVDGKPICYWIDVHDRAVPSNAGCVLLVRCENITVEGLSIRNNLDGILLLATNNTRINRNRISAVTWDRYPFDDYSGGIAALFGSSNLTITLNDLTDNDNAVWIYLGSNHNVSLNMLTRNKEMGIYIESSNSVVKSNSITNNTYGLIMWGSNNVATRNNIVGSSGSAMRVGLGSDNIVTANNLVGGNWGLELDLTSNNRIISNNIIGNWGFPMRLYYASSDKIFHNNFINNTQKVGWNYMSSDVWDYGYPLGGNYWSDYNGTDVMSGPGQDVPGSDGIGDTPYVVDADNVDRYPLMSLCNDYPAPQTQILPSLASILISQSVVFTSATSGFYPPFSYQWYLNSTVLSGARSSTWVFKPNASGHYIIYLKVTDSLGNTTKSNEAQVAVAPVLKVSISPSSVCVLIGEYVRFTSTTSGGFPPYSYQWYFNNEAVSGATGSEWDFAPNVLGNCRIYLNVTDTIGTTVKSEEAFLVVAPQLTVAISPASILTQTGQSVKFASTVLGGYPPYSYQWCVNGKPVVGATSNTWTFVPLMQGSYFVQLIVTDKDGNVRQSEVASIMAIGMPVGGYSFSAQVYTKAEATTPCVALIASLVAISMELKRKTHYQKRKTE